MQPSDDSALLRNYVRNNSEDAFATLVTRHVNLVYSVAMRSVGNPASAEEITQAVFIILARKAGQLRSEKALSSWLFQTTRLTANNFIRAEMRRRHREQEAHMQNILNQPEPELWPQIAPLLDNAVGALNEKDRRAILLRFYEGKNLDEIGTALGASEAATEKRVSRAIERLQKFFAKRGIHSTTTILAGTISANSISIAPVTLAKIVSVASTTKGATASASTLTLIKGALKIMAWTKAKTAIVTGAVVLLAAGTTTVAVREIHEHRIDESWRIPNPNADRAPMMVKILPTKFRDRDALNVGSRGDNWIGIRLPTLQIVRVAYNWRPGRILFAAPEPTDRYDFISTLPNKSGEALQTELKKKLGLIARPETRDVDVQVLKVRRANAPGLRPPLREGSGDWWNNDGKGNYHYVCDNSPISSDSGWYKGITRILEDHLGMPVVDQTGLTQNYHIDMRWKEKPDETDHEGLKQALLDQLGLELVPTNLPVEMLVVEKAK